MTPPDVRPRRLRLAALLALCVAAALGTALAWRHARWDADLEDVRFLDHPEKITGRAAAVTVTGYIVATVSSDVDFFASARAEGTHPKVVATLCDSGKPLDAWSDPLPRDDADAGKPFRYAVLVPARSAKADLATSSEDLCVRFFADAAPWLSGAKSRPVVVPVRGALRDQLVAYAQRDGVVQLVMDPACLPLLCQPDFTPRDLKP
jgi:hypothetical protein